MQTDNGGEFITLRPFLEQCGITLRHCCPYAHKQNSLVERKHRHIIETVLTLLSQSSLPLKYWDETVCSASFLINRLLSPVLSHKSPIEMLFNVQPDYAFLKVFGCNCFPNMRPFNWHKFSFRTIPCTFVGYNPKHKGYKCLTDSRKIIISRDVLFYEHLFPFFAKSNFKNSYTPRTFFSMNSPTVSSLVSK